MGPMGRMGPMGPESLIGRGAVRTIAFEKIAEAVRSLCVSACHELPADVLAALERAAGTESNPRARRVYEKLGFQFVRSFETEAGGRRLLNHDMVAAL